MSIGKFLAVVLWIIGIVVSKGFWSTFFCVLIPFWSWYISIEHYLIYFKLI